MICSLTPAAPVLSVAERNRRASTRPKVAGQANASQEQTGDRRRKTGKNNLAAGVR